MCIHIETYISIHIYIHIMCIHVHVYIYMHYVYLCLCLCLGGLRSVAVIARHWGASLLLGPGNGGQSWVPETVPDLGR